MIGCFAQSLSGEIQVDGNEILSARWFERADVKRLLDGQSREVTLPRRDAIAFHLISHWAEAR